MDAPLPPPSVEGERRAWLWVVALGVRLDIGRMPLWVAVSCCAGFDPPALVDSLCLHGAKQKERERERALHIFVYAC